MLNRAATLTALGTLTAGLLASCGQSSDASTPIVRATPGTGDAVTSFQVQLKSTTSVVKGPGQGQTATSPVGLRLAYLFSNGNMRIRADIPGMAFPDGEARILLMDPHAQQARVLLKSTLATDKSIDPALVAQLGQNVAGQTAGMFDLMDKTHPFRKLTTNQFRILARKAAFDVTGDTDKQLILTRTIINGNTQTRLKLTFDETVGAVTTTESTTLTPDVKYTAVNTIHYADVQGMDNTAVPYEINSDVTSELVGDKMQSPINLPTADERLPDKTEPTLKPGEYVAQTFTAVPGEGVTNINKSQIKAETMYEDIAVNTVKADFFAPEAK